MEKNGRLLASKTARMKKGRQEENVALISERMSIQQRHSSVGPMPSHQPYNEHQPSTCPSPTGMRGPCTMMGEVPVPAHSQLNGYFGSSDSLIGAGDDEDFPRPQPILTSKLAAADRSEVTVGA